MSEATRHNKGKPKFGFILDAPRAIELLSMAFEVGVEKYGLHNWKGGLDNRELMDSMLRHATDFQNGDFIDDETGVPNVGLMLWNAFILAEQHKDKNDGQSKSKLQSQ